MARRSWPIEAVVGVDSWLHGSDSLGMGRGFNSATNWLEFSFNFASTFATIFSAIFALIAPRSGVDRGVSASSVTVHSTGDDSMAKSPRSRLDCAAIAVRSGRDRGVLPQAADAVGLESDAPPIFTNRGRSGFSWPSDRNPTLPRSSRREADRASRGHRIDEVR